jgi:undecaprenyl pyrophosphate synthase
MYINQKPFFCEFCGYKTNHKSNFEKHLETQKHVFRKNRKKSMDLYECFICDYSTSRKRNYDAHLLTLKHQKNQKQDEKVAKTGKIFSSNKNENICIEIGNDINDVEENNTPDGKKSMKKTGKKVCDSGRRFFCECGKSYKYSQGLYTHRKKCEFKEKNDIEEIIQERVNKEVEKQRKIDSETTNKKLDLCMDIIQNQVLPNIQQTAITNINNTTNNTNNTNNFNLNIFLNETCKDAINITEFIENLKVGLQELEFVKDNGIVKGISNVFVNELNALDVDKRPIHCTDAKRKTLYIKDDDKWDKENKATNAKIDRSIQHVKKKHVDSIKEWEEKNPNWCDDEKLAMEYLRMVRNSTTPIDKTGEKKIISELAAEVDITDIKNKGGD